MSDSGKGPTQAAEKDFPSTAKGKKVGPKEEGSKVRKDRMVPGKLQATQIMVKAIGNILQEMEVEFRKL